MKMNLLGVLMVCAMVYALPVFSSDQQQHPLKDDIHTLALSSDNAPVEKTPLNILQLQQEILQRLERIEGREQIISEGREAQEGAATRALMERTFHTMLKEQEASLNHLEAYQKGIGGAVKLQQKKNEVLTWVAQQRVLLAAKRALNPLPAETALAEVTHDALFHERVRAFLDKQ